MADKIIAKPCVGSSFGPCRRDAVVVTRYSTRCPSCAARERHARGVYGEQLAAARIKSAESRGFALVDFDAARVRVLLADRRDTQTLSRSLTGDPTWLSEAVRTGKALRFLVRNMERQLGIPSGSLSVGNDSEGDDE